MLSCNKTWNYLIILAFSKVQSTYSIFFLLNKFNFFHVYSLHLDVFIFFFYLLYVGKLGYERYLHKKHHVPGCFIYIYLFYFSITIRFSLFSLYLHTHMVVCYCCYEKFSRKTDVNYQLVTYYEFKLFYFLPQFLPYIIYVVLHCLLYSRMCICIFDIIPKKFCFHNYCYQ